MVKFFPLIVAALKALMEVIADVVIKNFVGPDVMVKDHDPILDHGAVQPVSNDDLLARSGM